MTEILVQGQLIGEEAVWSPWDSPFSGEGDIWGQLLMHECKVDSIAIDQLPLGALISQ